MTRPRCIITVFLLFFGLLSGCGTPVEPVSDPAGTPADIAAEIIGSQMDIPPLEALFPDEEAFPGYLTQIYGVSDDGFADGVICYAGGVEASEIAVLVFSDEAAAKSAESNLLEYIERRADSFTGYVPEQAAVVEGSTAVSHGRYAALLICADPAEAQKSFLACFEPEWEPTAPLDLDGVPPQMPEPEEEAPEIADTESGVPESRVEAVDVEDVSAAGLPDAGLPVPQPDAVPVAPAPGLFGDEPEPAGDMPDMSASPDAADDPAEAAPAAEDHYDTGAVVSAWRGGSPADLSEKDRAIYDAAAAVIAQVITDGMTPYQKELAIHDYITAHCGYDQEANSNAPDAAPDPDNDNPYGVLVNGVGICWGYTSTFQLFMDLLELECITVPGKSGTREHAWNMVRLDGEWYCVDVTWDDPIGGSPGHRYFNVTSRFFRMTNHQWDRTVVPEATGTVWAYQQ